MKSRGRAEALILLVAAIWGFGFVAQCAAMKDMAPFAFNAIRFALGALSLVPVLLLFRPQHHAPARVRLALGGGVGLVLFAAASLQQVGMTGADATTAGKAGFITALYVVIVPLLGFVLGQRIGIGAVAGVVLAVVGMFLLTVKPNFSIGMGDLVVLIGALFWAVHVQMIDRFTARVATLELACIQSAVCALLSGIVSLCIEHTTAQEVRLALVPVLYAGVVSVGIAYTLQVVGQKHVPPTHAAILLSMESAFAAFGGWLLLSEHLSLRAGVGCALMLAGMIVAQVWHPATKAEQSA